MPKLKPCLWHTDNAEEAVAFHVSVFPDSRIHRVSSLPGDTPSGPAGSVKVVEYTLAGVPFMAFNGGPLDPFNHAVSFVAECADQAEIDRTWDALLDGGTPEQCGWLRDRYGVCWQVVPAELGDMMSHPDRVRAARAMQAFMGMVKFDIAQLRAAFDGTA